MPSTILSDNGVSSGTSGIKTTGSNDGALALQTTTAGGTATTALSIDTSQNVTFAGTVTNPAGTVSAPSITFTGDTNTGIFSPAADTIAFTEGGVESMRIDSSGNVGIGVTPSFKLDISGGGSSAKINTLDTFDGGASISTWQKVGRRAGTGNNVYINTVHSGSDAVSALTWAFGTSSTGTETLRLAGADGTLILKGGSTSATGTGITFPATQSASSDANTLDDYEEGTIDGNNLGITYTTPGTLSVTYSERRGVYTKIGRVVYFTTDIRIATFSKGTASGSLLVTGLPFAQRNTAGYDNARCTVQLYDWTYTTSPIIAAVRSSSTSIEITRMVSNAVSVDIDDPKAGSIIWITGFYFV